MATSSFALVYAATRKGGIGKDGKLPWPLLREDLKRFHTITTPPEGQRSVVIMGAKTWASLPTTNRPLAKRDNVVLSSSQSREALGLPDGVQLCRTLEEALLFADTLTPSRVHGVFVIGGAKVFEEAQHHPRCTRVYMTEILAPDFPADVHFKLDVNAFTMNHDNHVNHDEATGIWYQHVLYVRSNLTTKPLVSHSRLPPEHKETKEPLTVTMPVPSTSNVEELQYLSLVEDIIKTGVRKSDRTGIGTLSKFGCMAKYDLRGGKIPLLTTKRVFWRGVVEELIWLMAGKTSAKALQEKKVHIWDGNGTKTFLDSVGQGYREEFDLGPIYGHQWRFFGAPYVDSKTDYSGQGVDQLADLVQLIKKSPDSRRILMSAWNPVQLKEMALPPCHVLCQFYIAPAVACNSESKTRGSGPHELHCAMYQRSCDMGLGVPFNIASYSLLTHLLAHVCGLRPGTFTHMMGDTHVYLNHVEPLKEQLARVPTAFPTLRFKRPLTSVEEFTYADVELIGYTPQLPDIKMEMAV